MVQRGDARRRELEVALSSIFLKSGFLHLGIGEIAESLQCSRRTLYALAQSKEQLITRGVRNYFRESTAVVDAAVAAEREPAARVRAYLDAISGALSLASPKFFEDLAEFPPAREIYERNTEAAVSTVQTLLREALGAEQAAHADFLGAAAGAVMAQIRTGELSRFTGESDAEAYGRLADLVEASMNQILAKT